MWKIKQLHENHGPIIRINPIHLQISDPDYLDEIYAGGGRRRHRCSWFMAAPASGAQSWSMIQTMDHDHHRRRRQRLSTFFSKRNIQSLEKTLVRREVLELCDRLAEAHQSTARVSLVVTMSALTMDVISEYCFGEDIDTLRDPTLAKEWLEFFHNAAKNSRYQQTVAVAVGKSYNRSCVVDETHQPILQDPRVFLRDIEATH